MTRQFRRFPLVAAMMFAAMGVANFPFGPADKVVMRDAGVETTAAVGLKEVGGVLDTVKFGDPILSAQKMGDLSVGWTF